MKVREGPPGWRPQPKTPLQWHQKWTTEKVIWVPTTRGRTTYLELKQIEVAIDLPGNPDLIMTTTKGKVFYVKFRNGSAFAALDLPTLIFPVEEGPPRAFWILPPKIRMA